jgi:hypothetical protein
MAQSAGYKSKACLAMNSRRKGASDSFKPAAWPLTSTYARTGAGVHQIPFESESIVENLKFLDSQTLEKKAGIDRTEIIAKNVSGDITCTGMYLGLDRIYALALGIEKFRTASLESPVFGVEGQGSTITGTTDAAGNATTVLELASDVLTSANIDDYVRIEELSTNPQSYDQVRRIVSVTDADTAVINSTWAGTYSGLTPNSKPFTIAREFLHTFECCRTIHGQPFGEILTGTWSTAEDATASPNARRINRWCDIIIDKTVAYWHFQRAMIDSLTIKLNTDGMKVTASIIAPCLDLADTLSNNSTAWGYSPCTYKVIEPVMFGDFTFSVGAYATSAGSIVSQGISEFEITIKNNLQGDLQTLTSGIYIDEPMRNGKREITGSFTVPRYSADTLINYYKAGTALMGKLAATGSTIATGKTNEFLLWLRKMKITKADANIDGAGVTGVKYNFTCIQPEGTETPDMSGAPTVTTGLENGEIIIQTRNQNPFNSFMDQYLAD